MSDEKETIARLQQQLQAQTDLYEAERDVRREREDRIALLEAEKRELSRTKDQLFELAEGYEKQLMARKLGSPEADGTAT